MSTFDKKNAGLICYQDLKKPGIKLLYWIFFALMLFIAFICIAPPVWVILSSMKDIKEFFQIPPTIIPKSFHPEKLVEAWTQIKFYKYYINTLEITLGTVVFSVVFNGLLGFVLSRLKPKGSSVIFLMVVWTMMLPNSISMVPLFKNIIKMPLIHINISNTFWPLWLMAGANAFFVLVFKGFFDGIPKALIEAARLDGCNDMSIFFKVVLPLSKPVIMVVLIFTLNNTWSDFFWPYLILKDPQLYTVIVRIYTMKAASGGYTMDLQMVALTFAIIPPAILFLIFQKYIMQGFTLSGIKG